MTSLISTPAVFAAALALGLAGAPAAHASSDVTISIGLQSPYLEPAPVYVQPAPVVVAQRRVYVAPRTVYVAPRTVYVAPRPVYYRSYEASHRRGPWGDADRDGVPNRYDRDSRFHDGGFAHRAGWGDRDRDGTPNRYDRAPYNPYRR